MQQCERIKYSISGFLARDVSIFLCHLSVVANEFVTIATLILWFRITIVTSIRSRNSNIDGEITPENNGMSS